MAMSQNWVMVISEQHRYQGVSYKSDIIVISGNSQQVKVVQVVKVVSRGVAYRVPGGQGIGLQGPRGSRGRPTGSQRVKG